MGRIARTGPPAAFVARTAMPVTALAAPLPDAVTEVDQTRLLRYRITRTELLVRRMFQECVAAFDLKPVDFSLLMLVDGNPGINQRQIGDVLHVSPPNLAIVVARLVKRRLLRQVRGRQDRRMQHLSLTASGAALLTAAEAEVRRMEQQLSAVLGSSEAPLLRALDRLDRLGPVNTSEAHQR
ncbi:MarR family winged helix-turn-helix transcriptional regulator [Xanthomonas oryzae]|uniref:MarR family winged helix-turn-helix transcriptional regulator n=1 Tax=Xanthomonas oryzae TaxID=347 RepID=UPI00102F128F|nr:MarR family transcriptional regulator [Xanthomonas oryzae]QBN70811.1 MarR family transcriptional regulator [Xanthomonas oryzae pv. oryzae]TAP10415.1 MarR family transcriptional regulator [Xanthomonas oryzae pv. oryzae]